MAIINRSAQPILVTAALCGLAARAGAGELGAVRDRVAALLGRPAVRAGLAFLAFGLLSIAWSHHARVSIGAFGELGGALLAALVLHAALPERLPDWFVKAATIAIAIGCLSIIGELATGMALRAELGVRNYTFIFKRSVTAILIVGWPVAALLWTQGKRSIGVALAFLFCLATYAAHSSTTAVGLAAGLAAAALVATRPRLAAIGMAGAIVLSFLVAPVLGDLAEKVLSSSLVERLDFAHGRERIGVWQSFGEVVKRRPFTGTGFGTSPAMAQEPVAAEVPDDRRVLLGAWHPHNAYLQVWVETGPLGALLAGAALVLAALGLGRLPPVRAAAAAALLGSGLVVMLVGHGAWQGWWSAVLGASGLVIARLPERVAPFSPSRAGPRRPRPGGP